MKFRLACIMLSSLLIIGCTGNKTQPVKKNTDSVKCNDTIPDSLKVVETDSATTTSEDGGWAPDQFRAEHYDEWVVVNQAIEIQQNSNGDIDFSKIDKLVREYVKKKNIRLPLDKCKRIGRIKEICNSEFDISGYDLSNMGEHIADGTRRLFNMYVNWLYLDEAKKVLRNKRININIDKELKLYGKLNDGMSDVCDSIAYCMAGSGSWMAWSKIQDISDNFFQDMYKAILGAKDEPRKGIDVPLDKFDWECKTLIQTYNRYEEDQPKDPAPTVKRFQKAFHEWYAYRKSVASKLRNGNLKKAYQAITYSNARIYFLHLKNRFNDIGMMSSFIEEVCLDENCTNQELLEYNYERKYQEIYSRDDN